MTVDTEEVYSLLIPLAQQHLLIPRSAVVEVSNEKTLSEYHTEIPWLLGSLEWENSLVPVVSFEGICGDDIPALEGPTRIVLLRCLTGSLSSRAVGVISQGFPQLVRVGEDAVQLENDRFASQLPILCQVRMANQTPLIPDVEQVEHMVAEALTKTA